MAFDALCLVPLLADLPFYVERHQDDATLWKERFADIASADAKDAVGILRRAIADGAGKPLPAFLTLWVSPALRRDEDAETSLAELVSAISDPDTLATGMRETSDHWSEQDERLFVRTAPALHTVVRTLQDMGLAPWWEKHARPTLCRRSTELTEAFGRHDLVALVEQHTHRPLGSEVVDVRVLRWAAPHAIRVTGTRFLVDVRYREQTVLNNAVHELLHPPWPNDHRVKETLAALADDPFLAARFAARDAQAGYNDWSGYVEEDAAQALDQLLLTKLGLETSDPITRWSTSDGGMHVLALLLHDALVRDEFDGAESYADFLDHLLRDDERWPDPALRYAELT